MHAVIISPHTLQSQGDLLVGMLRERHRVFIQEKGWDLPAEGNLEFDQYDTPQSRWVVITETGKEVIAGFRLTPTTANCAAYSYMIRDAQRGLLHTIPNTLLEKEAPVSEEIWECTRAFVSLDAADKAAARRALVSAFIPAVREVGGESLITLTNRFWPRWTRMHGLVGLPLGPVVEIDGEPFQVVLLEAADKAP